MEKLWRFIIAEAGYDRINLILEWRSLEGSKGKAEKLPRVTLVAMILKVFQSVRRRG